MQKNSLQFFGLPGSGKTTITDSLEKEYPESYIKVPRFSRIVRVSLTIFFIISFPRTSLIFLQLIIRNRFKLWSYLFHLASVCFASHLYVFLHSTWSKKMILIDEGLLQRFLSVLPYKLSRKHTEGVVDKLIHKGCIPVFVKGGDFKRFMYDEDRFMSPRNRMGLDYFKGWSENLLYNIEIISDVLNKTGECIEIDNTKKGNIFILAEKLNDLVRYKKK
jgi:hypothetical protein